MAIGIFVSGLVYIWAATRRFRPLVYVLKPGTMALIIALAVFGASESPAPVYAWCMVAGLLFSSVGDVLLMLPGGYFAGGLGAFLVAHVWYITGIQWGLSTGFVTADIATGLGMALLTVLFYRRLARGLRESNQKRLLVPVAIYASVIAIMVWRALSTLLQSGEGAVSPSLVGAGAVLFLVSDSALAWDRFVRPLPYRDALVMATYFGAQFCFALSVGGAPTWR